MDMTLPHVVYVVVSYGLSAFVLVAMICGVVWKDRALSQRLEQDTDQK